MHPTGEFLADQRPYRLLRRFYDRLALRKLVARAVRQDLLPSFDAYILRCGRFFLWASLALMTGEADEWFYFVWQPKFAMEEGKVFCFCSEQNHSHAGGHFQDDPKQSQWTEVRGRTTCQLSGV